MVTESNGYKKKERMHVCVVVSGRPKNGLLERTPQGDKHKKRKRVLVKHPKRVQEKKSAREKK
jgi:hypothetical protein